MKNEVHWNRLRLMRKMLEFDMLIKYFEGSKLIIITEFYEFLESNDYDKELCDIFKFFLKSY